MNQKKKKNQTKLKTKNDDKPTALAIVLLAPAVLHNQLHNTQLESECPKDVDEKSTNHAIDIDDVPLHDHKLPIEQ